MLKKLFVSLFILINFSNCMDKQLKEICSATGQQKESFLIFLTYSILKDKSSKNLADEAANDLELKITELRSKSSLERNQYFKNWINIFSKEINPKAPAMETFNETLNSHASFKNACGNTKK